MDKGTIRAYREYDPIHNVYMAIDTYNIKELLERYQTGSRFYAMYANGSLEEVQPEEVKDLRVAEEHHAFFVNPHYVNDRVTAIYNILNEILDPLLEILPDEEPQEEEIVLTPMNVNLKGASVQSIQAASTESDDTSEAVNESYKDKIRKAFNDLKTLVEEGESYVENDEQ